MSAFTLISFLNPVILWVIFTIPIIWAIIKLYPPKPQKIKFPPTYMLEELEIKEPKSNKTPWWLILIRLLIVALIIFSLSEPILNPDQEIDIKENRTAIFVIDDGWAASNGWHKRKDFLLKIMNKFENNKNIYFLTTTKNNSSALTGFTKINATKYIENLQPKPSTPIRSDIIPQLDNIILNNKAFELFWLTDNITHNKTDYDRFEKYLANLNSSQNPVTIIKTDNQPILIIKDLKFDVDTISLNLHSNKPMQSINDFFSGIILFYANDTRLIASKNYQFERDKTEVNVKIVLPADLLNQITKIELSSNNSVGTIKLIDNSFNQRIIGIYSKDEDKTKHPLLSYSYYLDKALNEEYTLIHASNYKIESLKSLLNSGITVLLVPNIGKLSSSEELEITNWISKGGILIRFANPAMANGSDNVLPVKLRYGERVLNSKLSWSKSSNIATFPKESPFYNLPIPKDLVINRQLLNQPDQNITKKLWANLDDGTPLVTAENRGLGLIVLFHVTSNTKWSNLPITGLFLSMLKKIVSLSNNSIFNKNFEINPETHNENIKPISLLNAFGVLENISSTTLNYKLSDLMSDDKSNNVPPGFYGNKSVRIANNLNITNDHLNLIKNNLNIIEYHTSSSLYLAPILIVIAIILFIIDMILLIFIHKPLKLNYTNKFYEQNKTLLVISVIFFLTLIPTQLVAQNAESDSNNEKQHNEQIDESYQGAKPILVYVKTGDKSIDEKSFKGLAGLSHQLNTRTSFKTCQPVGIDIIKDDIYLLPFIYWPITDDEIKLTQETITKLNQYLNNQGFIFFDTQNNETSFNFENFLLDTKRGRNLAKILNQLDIPAVELTPQNHVITKSFYILKSFPGLWNNGKVWLKKQSTDEDENIISVSSIIVGSNDYAGAWAMDEFFRPVYQIPSKDTKQREMSYRSGINIVLYALTGNYKGDQIHIPELMRRLNQ